MKSWVVNEPSLQLLHQDGQEDKLDSYLQIRTKLFKFSKCSFKKNLNFKILIKKNGDGLNYEISCQVVLLELNCSLA